jgi:uncharacterized membrane protein
MPTKERQTAGARITSARLRGWHESGVIDQDELAVLEEGLVRSLPWETWATRLLAGLATLLLLCGVIFFFAYNWHRLASMQKFLTIGTGWGLCMIGAAWFDTRRWAGELCLLGAAVLTGVFLAVFGQVYQTGADSYQLFLGGGLFIVPLAVWGRSGALWLLWLAVANIALALAWEQVLFPADWLFAGKGVTALGALNVTALVLIETGRRLGLSWLSQAWLRYSVLTVAMGFLTVGMCDFILESASYSISGTGWTPGLWGGAMVAGFLYYRFQARSLPPLAVLMLSGCMVAILGLAHLILDGRPDPVAVFLLLGVATLGIFLTGMWGLKVMARRIHSEDHS